MPTFQIHNTSAFYKSSIQEKLKTPGRLNSNMTRILWVFIFIIGFSVRSTHLFQQVNTDSWREADVSTMAKNFYLNGTNIFHPQVAYDGSGPGYVESEFQIYSYLIATSYKIFGFWEPTGRVISFLFSLGTMLVFFKFSSYLFRKRTALAASFFFSLSPILMVTSVAIQPEAVMFFFYVCSGYTFVRWLASGSKRYYLPAIIFTALTLLCKITAANIGILFLLLIIFQKGWKFLLKPKVLILGVSSILPSILWYSYGHKFYTLYGNSLGLSNENPWIGWDFFTSGHLITGLFKVELFNVWTLYGPAIVILALVFTKIIKKENFLLGLYWFASVSIFYVIASRTTAESWAWYYHIFSIPAVSILLGSSVMELYDKYSPQLYFEKKIIRTRREIAKSGAIIFFLTILVSHFIFSSFTYFVKTKPTVYQPSPFYACRDSLKNIIPQNALLLTNGGPAKDPLGYSLAINIGYFYYWLGLKGYSISVEDLSVKNISTFKARGVNFFLAEERILHLKPGIEYELKRNFKAIFECNGCVLFKL